MLFDIFVAICAVIGILIGFPFLVISVLMNQKKDSKHQTKEELVIEAQLEEDLILTPLIKKMSFWLQTIVFLVFIVCLVYLFLKYGKLATFLLAPYGQKIMIIITGIFPITYGWGLFLTDLSKLRVIKYKKILYLINKFVRSLIAPLIVFSIFAVYWAS